MHGNGSMYFNVTFLLVSYVCVRVYPDNLQMPSFLQTKFHSCSFKILFSRCSSQITFTIVSKKHKTFFFIDSCFFSNLLHDFFHFPWVFVMAFPLPPLHPGSALRSDSTGPSSWRRKRWIKALVPLLGSPPKPREKPRASERASVRRRGVAW